jgi:hypothetical protein
MTLTDEEKQEARGTDPRAAAIIDRCEGMSEESLGRLHGAVRAVGAVRPATAAAETLLPWWDPGVDDKVDPWTDTIWVGPIEVGKGFTSTAATYTAGRRPRPVPGRTYRGGRRRISRRRRRSSHCRDP